MGRRIGRRLQDIEEIFTSLVKKQIIWDYKFIKKRQFMIVSQKPYNENECVTLGTCERLHKSLYSCTKIKMNQDQRLKKELQM